MHETIAANIALGSPTASLDDIRIAARGAQTWLHGGYDWTQWP